MQGVGFMDIAAMSVILSQGQIQQQASVQVASKAVEVIKEQGDNLVKMMEQSVSPELGRSIDFKL